MKLFFLLCIILIMNNKKEIYHYSIKIEKKNFLLGSILNIPIKKWVNNIINIQNASYKLNQLKVLDSISDNSLLIPKL